MKYLNTLIYSEGSQYKQIKMEQEEMGLLENKPQDSAFILIHINNYIIYK